MPIVKSFEDLFVWQKSRELAELIYDYTRKQTFSRDYGLIDQIRRAVVSILSNIAEGFERGGKEEILYFLYIAKAFCGEVRSQLYVAFDQDYISDEELKDGVELAKYVSALIFKFIDGLKVSKYKGLKFKKPVNEKEKELEELIRGHLPRDHPLLNSFKHLNF
ncbi:four helix bundle protein [Candidatus Jorgensenbacteria bacterium CG03_land_8_20_14_0_80_38_39]|nr:MAG: four helix bundle protein [Candidatus Jorgensenbacteria bacterium CG03_land_8_20_14_0_80_38_39]